MKGTDAETVRGVTPSASPFCLLYSITVLIFESFQVRNSVEELVHVGGGGGRRVGDSKPFLVILQV